MENSDNYKQKQANEWCNTHIGKWHNRRILVSKKYKVASLNIIAHHSVEQTFQQESNVMFLQECDIILYDKANISKDFFI